LYLDNTIIFTDIILSPIASLGIRDVQTITSQNGKQNVYVQQ